MNINNIAVLIDQIPRILKYFIPGYLFLGIFYFLSGKKKFSEKHLYLQSVVISFVLITILETIFILLNYSYNTSYFLFLVILMSIITSYILFRVNESESFERVLKKLKIFSSTRNSIWDDYIDSNGTYVTFFLDGIDLKYEGSIASYDCDNLRSDYLVIADYVVKDSSDKTLNHHL